MGFGDRLQRLEFCSEGENWNHSLGIDARNSDFHEGRDVDFEIGRAHEAYLKKASLDHD